MKLLSILLSLLFVVGCSFKKDDGNKEKTDSTSTRESVEKAVSSNFDKLAYAIEMNDSILFENTLKQAKKSDLNQLSPYGRSLLEISLRNNRLDFFKKLIKAGASPFRPTHDSPEGLRTTFVSDIDAKNELLSAVHGGLAGATRVCLMNDLKRTLAYLEENFISPYYRVCGSLNLYEYYLNPEVSGIHLSNDLKIDLVRNYINLSRVDRAKNISALLSLALQVKEGGLIAVLAAECLREQSMCLNVAFDSSVFTKAKIEQVLETYRVFKTAIFENAIFVRDQELGDSPLPPPPPPRNGQVSERDTLDIVTVVQKLVRARVAQLPDYEREALAQQLHELELD